MGGVEHLFCFLGTVIFRLERLLFFSLGRPYHSQCGLFLLLSIHFWGILGVEGMEAVVGIWQVRFGRPVILYSKVMAGGRDCLTDVRMLFRLCPLDRLCLIVSILAISGDTCGTYCRRMWIFADVKVGRWKRTQSH
jgi:hypothetical protein